MRHKTRYVIRRPKGSFGISVIIFICLLLVLLILCTQGKIEKLQDLMGRQGMASGELPSEEGDALVQQMPYSQNLRIVLMDRDKDIYRGKVTVHGDGELIVERAANTQNMAAGTPYSVSPDQLGEQDRIRVYTTQGNQWYVTNEDGQVSNGYEGVLEIRKSQGEIVLVNEIPMENYLKRVVPSEMPRTYGAQALKAQAVCARTYAYGHSNRYAYPEVDGHMDDTVSFQVYNQGAESLETNQGIMETAGQILCKDGQVVDTLYYSTSCGYMQDGSLFGEMDGNIFESGYIGMEEHFSDIDSYIRNLDPYAYEAQERYFRWQASVTDTDLSLMRQHLNTYLTGGEGVSCDEKLKKKIMDSGFGDTEVFGRIKNIQVSQRNAGGAAMRLVITTEGGRITVEGQQRIRQILGDLTDYVVLQNKEQLDQVSMLPSSVISVDRIEEGKFLIYGGGYGHGVGMSQNGAKALAAAGYGYQDILKFFYHNTEVMSITETTEGNTK